MKKIIMILVALGLVGGGGYAAYTMLNQKAEAAVDGAGESKGEKTAKAEKGDKKDESVEFVQLDPLMLPIVDKKGSTQMMSIVITLEIGDPANVEKVTHMQPRLTDAYIRDMYGVLSQKAAMPNGVLQVEMIRKRLENATVAILGENVVNDILLQHLQQNPI